MPINQQSEAESFFLFLERPVVFFDIETTGLDLANDRIVELCAIRYSPQREKEELHYYINPTIPIPREASEIHGITDETVANQPKFEDLAEELSTFFTGCDLGGFNIQKFDIPFLMQEFHRFRKYPILMGSIRIVDSYSIYLTREKRDLSSAVKFYCGKEHVDAHSAKNDVLATIDVLKHQLLMYPDMAPKCDSIHDACSPGLVDFSRKFRLDANGEMVFNFGKHDGKLARSEKDYLRWMLSVDMPIDTKMIATKILKHEEWGESISKWLEKEISLDVEKLISLFYAIEEMESVEPIIITEQDVTHRPSTHCFD